MRRHEKIERQEENRSGSVEIKFMRRLVIEFRIVNGIWDNFRIIVSIV